MIIEIPLWFLYVLTAVVAFAFLKFILKFTIITAAYLNHRKNLQNSKKCEHEWTVLSSEEGNPSIRLCHKCQQIEAKEK